MEEAMRSSETAIRNALLGEALAQTSMDQAASRLYPVLAFTANFGDQFNAISAGAFSGDARVKNTSAALTLNFNLFNGGATKRALDQAAIQMDLAITASENQVAASLLLFRNAVDQFETQQAIHGMAKATVVNAEQLVSIAGDRYAFGALNSLEVRQLQLNLLRAEVNQLQVLQSWNSAWLDLQRLSGNLRPARLQSPGY
jgi:outer membrane protein TolC